MNLSSYGLSSQISVPPPSSSMMAPGLPEIKEHYHITSPTILNMTLSIFLLAYATGPLFLSPMSEIVGRKWVRTSAFIPTKAIRLTCFLQVLHLSLACTICVFRLPFMLDFGSQLERSVVTRCLIEMSFTAACHFSNILQ